jgi:cytochrome b subunit of formate dehydrogenase
MQEYLLPIPVIIFGGIVIWIMIFLGTYPHFPKMDKQKRIELSVTSATIMAIAFMIMVYIAMILLIEGILK